MRKNKLLVLICLLVFTLILLSACINYSSNGNQSDNDPSMNSNDDVSMTSSESTKSGNSKFDNDSGKRKLRFQGKSNNWKVEYLALTKLIEQPTVGPIGNQTDYIELQYIGDGQPPTEIEYYISSPAGDKSGIDESLKDGNLEINGAVCDNCIILTENDVMEMTIEWSGKKEHIKLKTK